MMLFELINEDGDSTGIISASFNLIEDEQGGRNIYEDIQNTANEINKFYPNIEQGTPFIDLLEEKLIRKGIIAERVFTEEIYI